MAEEQDLQPTETKGPDALPTANGSANNVPKNEKSAKKAPKKSDEKKGQGPKYAAIEALVKAYKANNAAHKANGGSGAARLTPEIRDLAKKAYSLSGKYTECAEALGVTVPAFMRWVKEPDKKKPAKGRGRPKTTKETRRPEEEDVTDVDVRLSSTFKIKFEAGLVWIGLPPETVVSHAVKGLKFK